MKKNILIIGAGIHGCFIAKYLSNKKDYNITMIEKENDICLGSSSATHNRANRGYHYPRSQQTASECMSAYDYFKSNYKKFLKQMETYYCIEKKSKTSLTNYLKFFKKNNLKYKLIKKSKFIKNESLEAILKVEEGCFDHFKIKKYLKKELDRENVSIYLNFNLEKIDKIDNEIILFGKNKKKIKIKPSLIINCTYNNCNQIIKLFKKDFEKISYKQQLTEVAVIESKKYIPGITIMDGPFITIMPLMGSKKKYLLYDVENSILKTSTNSISKINAKSNYFKMNSKRKKYLKNYKIKYLYSNFGYRPIPLKDFEANRSTKILTLKINDLKMINILEGKYISAPFIARNLSRKI